MFKFEHSFSSSYLTHSTYCQNCNLIPIDSEDLETPCTYKHKLYTLHEALEIVSKASFYEDKAVIVFSPATEDDQYIVTDSYCNYSLENLGELSDSNDPVGITTDQDWAGVLKEYEDFYCWQNIRHYLPDVYTKLESGELPGVIFSYQALSEPTPDVEDCPECSDPDLNLDWCQCDHVVGWSLFTENMTDQDVQYHL